MKTKRIILSIVIILFIGLIQVSSITIVQAETPEPHLTANEIVHKTLDLGFYRDKDTNNATFFNPYGPNANKSYNFMSMWAYNGENFAGGPVEFDIGISVEESNPELDAKIKTILNWILPTQGDKLYSILDDPNIYPNDISAEGRDRWTKEQHSLLKSYGLQLVPDRGSHNRYNLFINLDGRDIQIEFSNWIPLSIFFGPAESNGIRTGWKYIDNNYYYFGNDGSMRTYWQLINNKWYYLGSNGALTKEWQFINNKWYFLGYNGYMYTNWFREDMTYYLGDDGAMRTGWQKINDKWYYFNSSGAMETGWSKINNKWYYFTPYDYDKEFEHYGDMKVGVQIIDGKSYYFGDDGALQ